jgi:MoxR-like ATPase
MMKKTLLGQDMFLLAPPGPVARWHAFRFCELAARECLCVSITPDTTESDLKQRREIVGKTLTFVDSAAVTAAKRGWVLVIEGLELAERGVVTVLNNLLESREMHLEDGTFLTSAARFDSLKAEDRAKHALVRVDPRFRVIVAGVPTPKFRGNPLDPPLRSRFQYRWVGEGKKPSELLSALAELCPEADRNTLRGLVSFAASQNKNSSAPPLPHDALVYSANLLQRQPNASVARVLQQAFPYRHMALDESTVAAIDSGLRWLGMADDSKSDDSVISPKLLRIEAGEAVASDGSRLAVAGGETFLETSFEAPLFAALTDVTNGYPILITGERGWGKSHLAQRIIQMSGRNNSTLIQLFEDFSARDLLQRRSTNLNGDTVWIDSEIICAAKEGKIIVLDGVDSLRAGVLFSLKRLIQDGEIELPDGSLLISAKKKYLLRGREISQKMVAVDPRFRIIAMGNSATKKKPWLESNILSLFKVHVVECMSDSQLGELLQTVGGKKEIVFALLQLNVRLREVNDSALPPLSLRQLIRLCRKEKDVALSANDLRNSCFLAPFLPLAARTLLSALLTECGFQDSQTFGEKLQIEIEKNNCVRIGRASAPIRKDSNLALIPNVSFFFPAQSHLKYLESMLSDYSSGEHLLLIGTQVRSIFCLFF